MNASGLYDDNQYTTPVEMAMILKYAMENETCAEVLSTYQYTTAPLNSNPEGVLLTSTMFSRMYGTEVEGVLIQAGKTGYTQEARHCLVSYAEKGEHHYIALTAGAESKWYVIYDDFELYGNYLP
jgi:D-alanyl-D-alanine carboxypeptidase (penicillin-binding protein 5/6)